MMYPSFDSHFFKEFYNNYSRAIEEKGPFRLADVIAYRNRYKRGYESVVMIKKLAVVSAFLHVEPSWFVQSPDPDDRCEEFYMNKKECKRTFVSYCSRLQLATVEMDELFLLLLEVIHQRHLDDCIDIGSYPPLVFFDKKIERNY